MQSLGLVLKIRGMAYTKKSQILLVLMKKLQAKSAILLFVDATFFWSCILHRRIYRRWLQCKCQNVTKNIKIIHIFYLLIKIAFNSLRNF